MVGARFVWPSVKLFADYIRTEGYPLPNFISGDSIRNDRSEIVRYRTRSDRSTRSDVFLIGANLAF